MQWEQSTTCYGQCYKDCLIGHSELSTNSKARTRKLYETHVCLTNVKLLALLMCDRHCATCADPNVGISTPPQISQRQTRHCSEPSR